MPELSKYSPMRQPSSPQPDTGIDWTGVPPAGHNWKLRCFNRAIPGNAGCLSANLLFAGRLGSWENYSTDSTTCPKLSQVRPIGISLAHELLIDPYSRSVSEWIESWRKGFYVRVFVACGRCHLRGYLLWVRSPLTNWQCP